MVVDLATQDQPKKTAKLKQDYLHTEFRAQLKRAQLSQAGFAKLAGVSTVAVNNWCTGRGPIPKWAFTLAQMIEAVHLELSIDEAMDSVNHQEFEWFETLGILDSDPTAAAAARQYRALAKRYHPDAGFQTAGAMQRINNAYALAKQVTRGALLEDCAD